MQEVKPTKKAESATAEVRAQHTPGPWKISHPGYMNGAIVVHGNQLGDGATNDVAYCDGENKEANARLIAAAPELLEACKRLVAITRNADAQQLKIAIAAIDKAEGRAL